MIGNREKYLNRDHLAKGSSTQNEELDFYDTKEWKELVLNKPLTWRIASHEAQSRLLKGESAPEVTRWLTSNLLNENKSSVLSK